MKSGRDRGGRVRCHFECPDNAVIGHFQATGVRPRFLNDLAAMGIKVPSNYFDPSQPL